VALLLIGVVAVSALSEYEYQTMFTRWMTENNKEYAHEEFFGRYNTFKANVDAIAAVNALNRTYTLAVNKFADMTSEEFGRVMCGYKPALRATARYPVAAASPAVGADVDWVAKGKVVGVKDQGQCGSCWAFSATGAIESAWAISGQSLTSLSEQQLVDCAGSFGNQGCNGGLMDYAFQYIISNNGQASEAAYPYRGVDSSCKSQPSVAKISSFKDVTQGDEGALMTALQSGPVSVAVEADQMAWQFYSGGVLDDPSCGTNLDHGVLLVGAGTDGKDYWNVKNSWGTSWGEKGFIRLVRNKNQCGIASMNSYPVV